MKIAVFCDGSYSKELKSAGVGISFNLNHQQHDFSLPSCKTDSNDAEMDAAVSALLKVELIAGKEITSSLSISLYSDSDFVEREVNARSPKAQGFIDITDRFRKVDLIIIKSHRGRANHIDMANNHVDRLAKDAVNRKW